MPGKIFINYRREDDPGFAQALFVLLEKEFQTEQLFFDVESIPPGLDFVSELRKQVASCRVMLSLIGKNWISVRNDRDEVRLMDPNDFVRIEIASALSQQKWLIPVLLNRAPMPKEVELPDDLKPLATRNAIRLTHEHFRKDVDALISAVVGVLEEVVHREVGAHSGDPHTQRITTEEFAKLARSNSKIAVLEAWKEIRYALRPHGARRHFSFSPEGNKMTVEILIAEGKLRSHDLMLYRMLRQMRDQVMQGFDGILSFEEIIGYRGLSLELAGRISAIDG